MPENRKTKIPRKATQKSIENAALAYLQRYATSAENLRAVLMRRVHRAAYAHDDDPAAGAELVAGLIARYKRAGLLDDVAYAEGRVMTLHRRGVSRRGIHARLSAKGVSVDDIEAALTCLSGESEDVEFDAACNYARRRRLGPWRVAGRAERRDRDLAALARQGFGYDLASKIIDADDVAALEE
ncbi:MAG: RecX family transcriptional regulator [Alphaproteobacteria bacterium]|nr:RecX family transcriptional regulator [Alphaproteobacteria bacterium]